MGRLLAIVFVFSLALPVGPLRADDKSEPANAAADKRAEKLFIRGQKMFARGDFEHALRAYHQAFEAKPHPEFLFNIGQCYRNLGDAKQAVANFREYLRLKPEAGNREAVRRVVKKLEAEIADDEARNPTLVPKAKSHERDAVGGKKDDDQSKAFYKRWEFWTGVAVVSVAGGGTYYFVSRGDSVPASDLGNLDFGN